MREDYFNPETYAVIDRVTGEEVPVDIFIQKVSGGYWERAYAKVLAEYIEVSGTNSSKVLAAIITEKNVDNLVLTTVRGLAESISVSPVTVAKIFKVLQAKDLLKKVSNGKYLITPLMLRHGSQTRGAMLMRLWEDT